MNMRIFLLSAAFAASVWSALAAAELRLDSKEPGNVFEAENGELHLAVSPQTGWMKLDLELCDENGNTLDSRTLSPQAAQTIALPERGYYQVTVRGRRRDGSVVVAETRAAVVGKAIDEKTRMSSPFGLCGSGELFAKAGARWGRLFYELCSPEMEKWSKDGCPDVPVAPLADRFREMEPIYGFWPQPFWLQDRPAGAEAAARGDLSMYPIRKDKTTELVKIIQRAVTATSNRRYEMVTIANEPMWMTPYKDFVEYIKLYIKSIRAIRPGVKLIGPAHCDIYFPELKKYADSGMFKILDGVDIHAYVKATPPEGEFIELVRKLKSFLAQRGFGSLPIYITEFGWTTPPGDWQKPVDELTQARYCARSIALLAAENVKAILWFCLYCENPKSNAYGYALLNADRTPKAAYAAYATLTRELAGADHGKAKLDHPKPGIWRLRFPRNSGFVCMVWSPDGEQTWSDPKCGSPVRTMTGRVVPGSEVRGFKFAVSPSPCYYSASK
ncbi:MAG: glycosyl hydrolase [Victivallaceae bacterium]|nr:glycosyl hydrolase [Victivallaceae bacterium]